MITATRFVLAVPNLATSAAYYRDVLGFEVHEIGDPGWRFFVREGCTIMAGEHVQKCGGSGGGGGSGPGGTNPWGTIANKRVFGSLSLAPRAFAIGVDVGDCVPPPSPPRGVAWFSTGHSAAVHFLMGDGSVQPCTAGADVESAAAVDSRRFNILVPALAQSDFWVDPLKGGIALRN